MLGPKADQAAGQDRDEGDLDESDEMPRSKMVCVLQTYMGKEFNVNGQTV